VRAAPSARPSAASVRLALLFGLGSVCFAVGSLPLYAARVAPEVAAWTFVVGSVLFTSAAAFQLGGTPRDDRTDWVAALVQLVGTVCFNVSTYAATRDLAAQPARRLVWAPDVYGSVCFLVASVLACVAVRRAVRPRAVHGVMGRAGRARRVAPWVRRLVGRGGQPRGVGRVRRGGRRGAVRRGDHGGDERGAGQRRDVRGGRVLPRRRGAAPGGIGPGAGARGGRGRVPGW
jgi:hypothetical protein